MTMIIVTKMEMTLTIMKMIRATCIALNALEHLWLTRKQAQMSTHKWWWNNLGLYAPCCKLDFHKNCYHVSVGLNVLNDDDDDDEMSQAGLFELVSALQHPWRTRQA